MREEPMENEELKTDSEESAQEQAEDSKRDGKGKKSRDREKKADLRETRELRKIKRKGAFWNRFDGLNKFRHWYIGIRSFASGIFRVLAAWQTIVVLGVLLTALYVFTAFYTGKGEFVIQVDRPMANEGFILSEDGDFSDWLVTLRSDAVEDATNINITDIAEDVMTVNGKHNGRDYVAYTFYLKNKSTKTRDYEYQIHINNTYKDAEKATWIMVYQNGKQIIYAAPSKEGHAECQYSRWKFPFVEDALDPEYQLTTISNENPGYITQDVIQFHEFQDLDGIYQLQTVPFESEQNVCTRRREEIEPKEVDKYTVVIWLEGEDPECVNDILGGYVELNMKFYLAD